VRLLGGVVTVIFSFGAILGALNTMYAQVSARTREIGTLRAIGMQRSKVRWLILVETALLAVLGTAAGALGATGVALGLNAAGIALPEAVQVFLAQERLTFLLAPRAIVADVLFLAAVTVVASWFPARRAARLKPITAMHHVG
jgi:putative ABC transport system permease protein